MTYASALEAAPPELRMPLLRFAEAMEERMREQLAVRREDFDALRNTVYELGEAQKRTELRVEELAEAQKRTELRVEELTQAQKRTELRVEELTQAQKRSEERIERLEIAVLELAEAQKRSEERIGRLEIAVLELAEAQKRSEERIGRLEIAVLELAEAQKRTELRVEELAKAQKRTEQRLDIVVREQEKQRGDRLERQYREKPFAYFGRLMRRAQVVPLQELEAELEERLTDEEMNELRPLDLLVRGRLNRKDQPALELHLALEISAVVDRNDVERAKRRAAILRRAGYVTVSGVAGEATTQGGVESAQAEQVALFRNGAVDFWDEALAEALTNGTPANAG